MTKCVKLVWRKVCIIILLVNVGGTSAGPGEAVIRDGSGEGNCDTLENCCGKVI